MSDYILSQRQTEQTNDDNELAEIARQEGIAMATYNLQCINHGFVGICREGDPLYDECQKRENDGYIDALILGPKECPICIEENEKIEADRIRHSKMTEEEIDDEMFWAAMNY